MEEQWQHAVSAAKIALRRHQPPGISRSNSSNGSLVVAATAGAVAFGSATAAGCYAMFLAGVSTGSAAPVPTVCGVITVCAATLVSHAVATSAPHWLDDGRRLLHHRQHHTAGESPSSSYFATSASASSSSLLPWRGQRRSADRDALLLGPLHIPMHTLRICAVGLLCFKLLGGRFWALAPSSYTHVGSFARVGIPATERYATRTQRATMERLGRTWGCHTCGSRRWFVSYNGASAAAKFVGDHMPPKSVANQLRQARPWWYRRTILGGWPTVVPFRFYPQCVPCSNRQGSILSAATHELLKLQRQRPSGLLQVFRRVGLPPLPQLSAAGGGSKAYVHGWQPRLFHATGGIVAVLAADTPDQGQQRYETAHRNAEQWLKARYAAAAAQCRALSR